ncbi:MAG: Cdc6/Cdc18 family protein [Candidatus Bathyarchaeia archaeon]
MGREEIFGEDAWRSSRGREGGFEAGCPPIFLDREKLSPQYVPRVVLHRGRQVGTLQRRFESFLHKPGETFCRVVQVVGPVGTGKTCVSQHFGLRFQEEASKRGIPLGFIYVNCRPDVGTRYMLYKAVLQKISPRIASRGLSAGEMLHQLLHHLSVEERFALLAVDEIDHVVKRDGSDVIYDLTRLAELAYPKHSGVVGVILISRDTGYHKLLDPASRSSLGRVMVEMPPYTPPQLGDILTSRVEEAFQPGAVDEEIVDFVADIAGSEPFHGDCRVALDILWGAGLLAEIGGCSRVHPEHVRRAVRESHSSIGAGDLSSLSQHELLFLTGVVRELHLNEKTYVSLKDAWIGYGMACEEHEIEPQPLEKAEEHVERLETLGMVGYKPNKGISIIEASVEELNVILDQVLAGS